MNFGRISGEPLAAYHGTPAVSNSKLNVFRHSRREYFERYVTGTWPVEETKDGPTVLGAALHALLEGGGAALAVRFAVNRQFANFKTQEAKDWRDLALIDGKTILDREQFGAVRAMHSAVLTHPEAGPLSVEGEPEVTWRVRLNDLLVVQARTDRWHPAGMPALGLNGPVIVDFKSTASLATDGYSNFHRHFQDFGYYRQAALYREVVRLVAGEPVPRFLFVAVENVHPFQCAVFEPDETALILARNEIIATLRDLQRCIQSGVWTGAPEGITTIGLAPWFIRKRVEALDTGNRLQLQ